MIKISFEVKKKEWLSKPTRRWNAGLKRAGLNFMGELKDYPQKSGSTDYRRTGTLRKKANFQIVQEGIEMSFGSVFYAKFPLFGTGLYGPNHAPIVPVRARLLHWVGASGKHYFARQVKGYIWEGKVDKIVEKMKAGFAAGIREYKE